MIGVKKFSPEYIKFIKAVKGRKVEDFTIKKKPKAGLAVWRAIDKATGIDIGGGSSRALALDVIDRIINNKRRYDES